MSTRICTRLPFARFQVNNPTTTSNPKKAPLENVITTVIAETMIVSNAI